MSSSNREWIAIGISIGALVVSCIALLQAHNSNAIALNSNVIALGSNHIAEQQRDISKDANSITTNNSSNALVDATYQQIYDNGTMQAVRDKVQAKEKVQSPDNLVRFVDIFEGLGTNFCNGLVYHKHIKPKLAYEIGHVCSNQQVIATFAGHKNGLAMLCAEFIHQSAFGDTLNKTNLNQCHFLDSQVLASMK